MRYLVISDIHGNWEALESVLEDARGLYDRIVCCGDLVGYGPDPNRIVSWARENLYACIRGNHDRACAGMEDLEWFNPIAREATVWTIAELAQENIAWLRSLQPGPIVVDGFMVAHGSPLDEDEYLMTLQDAANIFGYLEANLTFFGHTHLQGGFSWLNGSRRLIWRPMEEETESILRIDPDGLYLMNPGSVGQPRDTDARASYAIYDTETRNIAMRRSVYDHEAVRNKIEAVGLPPALGLRLAFGR